MKNEILDLKQSILTGGYFAFALTDIDMTMKIIAFLVATGYTLRRWYLLEKNKKE